MRRAVPADADLIEVAFRVTAIDGAIADPDRFVVVAEAETGELVGWAKTHHWSAPDQDAPAGHYLGGLAVTEAWRRHGVGTALTVPRMAWLLERADALWCVTNARNDASLALHARLGFSEVARGSRFHTTTFDGGVGVLLRADALPALAPASLDTLTR